MDQFAIALFPLVYALSAQIKIKNYSRLNNKPETIALKIKVGFLLQIILLQLIELLIALLNKELMSSVCCLFLIIGLFYSFGITIIFHNEPLLLYLPFICLFNLISNSYQLKIFDLFSLIESILLAIYQRQRGDDMHEYNPFCEFFEQQDSCISQYFLLLKFQPNAYHEELELRELNENTQQQPLLTHSPHHPTSQFAQFFIDKTRHTRQQELNEPAILDIVFSKEDDDNWDKKIEIVNSPKNRKVRSSQIIMEENSQSEEISYPSVEKKDPKPINKHQSTEKRSLSQRELQSEHCYEECKEQVVKSEDEKEKPKIVEQNDKLEELRQYEHQSSNENQNEEIQPQKVVEMMPQKIVEIIDINKLCDNDDMKRSPVKKNFDLMEDEEYPSKLIVIPQQIQQELNKNKNKKKKKDEGLIAKKNRMMKRIKSFEEFQDKNDDNKSQNSDKFDDKKSDFEKYKDEVSSATLSDEDSESGVYIQQKMEKVQFTVGRQVIKKPINYQVKTLIPINIKVKNEHWVQNCQYQDLYQLANGHLPKPSFGDADIEKKLFFIQQWLDGMTQNPILMRKEVLEYFNVPESIMNKYGLVKKIEEETKVQRLSNKFMNSTSKDYFLQIKSIKVECYNSEVSQAFVGVVYYDLRFNIQTQKKNSVTECKKTLEEIKEATKIIQQERNLRVSLQEHETSKKQMKAIDQFLQELFSHQFYYCDKLFDLFDLLDKIK